MASMSINQWPAKERPRERLVQQGATALSDAELLAILIRHGSKGPQRGGCRSGVIKSI